MNIDGSLRVLNRHLQVFRRTWQHSIMFNVIEPLLYLTALGLGLGALVQQVDGMSYLQFIAPGMIALSAMYSATFECTYGTFVRLHYQKTFQALLAGPITVKDVILGEMFYGTLKSVLFGSVILGVISVLGQVHSLEALAIPLCLIVIGAVFAILAMFYTAVITSIDYLNYYITMIILPFLLFGGLYYPVSTLSLGRNCQLAQSPLSQCGNLPRACSRPASGDLAIHLVVLVIIGGIVLPFPLKLMEKRLIS